MEKELQYTYEGTNLHGFLATESDSPKPCVLVAPAWGGRTQFYLDKAKAIAKLGYCGFTLDMFGEGKLGTSKEECSKLIEPLVEDRNLLKGRVLAALEFAKGLEQVDASRIAAIGFCFGGMCVLDLARSGQDVAGVVSFHGLLGAPPKTEKISTKVLALHGYDDPMATPEQLTQFADEMTKAGADWQIHAYGKTMHAFTNPEANDPDFGTVYEKNADRRSWQAMQNFLKEVF